MAIQIPESGKKGLAALIRLPEGAVDQLYEALRDLPPRLRSRDIPKLLDGKVKVAATELREIVDVLLALYWVRAAEDLSLTEFVATLRAALEQDADQALHPPQGNWKDVESRLQRLLSLERSLGITSKALFVAYQFPRHFHSAKILTDARPVFTSDASEEPAAFVVNHTLKFDVHEGGEDREWFVAMNSVDLQELKRVVERAILKEKSLSATLKKTSASILEWED
jgi:hypothetical protein